MIEPNGILKAKPGANPPYCSEAEISKKSKLKTLNEKKGGGAVAQSRSLELE